MCIPNTTEWTKKELLDFQEILHSEVSSDIDLGETKEILTRLYSCLVMLMK
ncbi:hypothetical protein [Tenacibaculum xiamenense]|uniref:hypothetical protein n=1 Tax=Tenacibaculum xiamenense TaxID=1261553 RepID=UPI0038B4F750